MSWPINILKGATYEATITMVGVADIASATLWRVRAVDEAGNSIFNATTANGMLVAGATAAEKRLVLAAADTAALQVEAGNYDLEVEWSGGVVRRYIARGVVQVIPKAG